MKTIEYMRNYNDIQCRYAHKGCNKRPIGVFHTPHGCFFEEDPVMALCEDHLANAIETGPVELIIELPAIESTDIQVIE